MEYTNENGYSVKVVLTPELFLVQDIFHRIYLSDVEAVSYTHLDGGELPVPERVGPQRAAERGVVAHLLCDCLLYTSRCV